MDYINNTQSPEGWKGIKSSLSGCVEINHAFNQGKEKGRSCTGQGSEKASGESFREGFNYFFTQFFFRGGGLNQGTSLIMSHTILVIYLLISTYVLEYHRTKKRNQDIKEKLLYYVQFSMYENFSVFQLHKVITIISGCSNFLFLIS